MAFTNIIDIIYPVGSLYESTVSTSPATLFGGTWTQIKGACLAATGENNFAVSDYGGDLHMRRSQMPYHQHDISIHGINAVTTSAAGESWSGYQWDTNLYIGQQWYRDASHILNDARWEDSSWLGADDFQVPKEIMSTEFGKELTTSGTVLTGTGPRGGGARLFALPLWMLYVVSNCLNLKQVSANGIH